jgi:glycosyltransferase involved in cell wall biosynthesis
VLPFPSGVPTFLWLGNLDERKHAEVFIRAVASVAERVAVRGVVAGDGPDAPRIARLAQQLDAPIEMVGHRDPRPLLEQAWALGLFSRFEGLPLAVQESMWAGRAVVASPLPGTSWLVDGAGLLVTSDEAAAEALLRLTDRDTAAALGRKAALRVRQLFDPASPWPEVEAAYRADVL